MTLKRNKQRRERSEQRDARLIRQQREEELLDKLLDEQNNWPQHDDDPQSVGDAFGRSLMFNGE